MSVSRIFNFAVLTSAILMLVRPAFAEQPAPVKLERIPGLPAKQYIVPSPIVTLCEAWPAEPVPAYTSYDAVLQAAGSQQEYIRGLASYSGSWSDEYQSFSLIAYSSVMVIESEEFVDLETGEYQTSSSYTKSAYATTIDVFNEDGALVDRVSGLDRLQELYSWSYGDGRYTTVVVAELFLDGDLVLDTTESGKLRALAWIKYGDIEEIAKLTLMDVDHDFQPEALVFLSHQPSVIALTPTGYEDLQNWQLPSGVPASQLTSGVIVVELDGVTETPFTYYPVLELR